MPRSYSYLFAGLSWPDYLKVSEIKGVGDEVRDLRYELSSSNRKLIATHRELQREHIEATAAVSSGIERLHRDMQDLSSSLCELTGLFQWGFDNLLAGVGHINDSLTELIRIAKTPAQIWAYEQYEIARNAFRQGLYNEALDYLNRSIHGYGGNTGYILEHRFHFLLGTIRMGSFRNTSPPIVDLGEAEKAFLAADKYASHDHPKEAGRAFVAAGWTAYCQGRFDDADHFTDQALSLYPDLAEACFQSAKLSMHRGNPEKAMAPLKKAIELSRSYAIKASSDDDFKPYDTHVNSLILQLRKETQEKANTMLALMERETAQSEEFYIEEYAVNKYVDLNPVRNTINEARQAVSNNTYFGYLDAMAYCNQAEDTLLGTVNK